MPDSQPEYKMCLFLLVIILYIGIIIFIICISCDRVGNATADLEQRLEEANERAANARKQAGTLQEQVHVLE